MTDQKPLSADQKAQTLRRLFEAYKLKDRKTVEQLLTDTFIFTSPYDDAIDRAAYFERCWPNSDRIREHVIERIFVEGDEAFVTYCAYANEGTEFRNTEFFTFTGNQIASVNVYFGASYRDGSFVRKQAT
jgi:ketosteroid isomerase-like protein